MGKSHLKLTSRVSYSLLNVMQTIRPSGYRIQVFKEESSKQDKRLEEGNVLCQFEGKKT